MKKAVKASIILMGITSLSAQIIFTREFLVAFYGNELSLGLLLAIWLIGGGIGSAILGRISDKLKNPALVFSLLQIALSLILPISILLIRSIKTIFVEYPGQLLGLGSLSLAILIISFPICVILGFMFTLACNLYKNDKSLSRGVGKVYVLEAIGSVVGGLFITFILLIGQNSMNTILVLSILNLIIAGFMFLSYKNKRLILFLPVMLLLVMSVLWGANFWGNLSLKAKLLHWSGYEILETKDSKYGNISVLKRDNQISFLYNETPFYTEQDIIKAELAAHIPLLEHPNPKNVLLISGGMSGILEEILKHQVDKIDYLELDPMIISMYKKYSSSILDDPMYKDKIFVKNVGGRFFVKRKANFMDKYDVVIIRLGDPTTAQINRFYTKEFFKEVSNILNPEAIVSFAISSSETYIDYELKNYLQSLYVTVKQVFPDVKVIPSNPAYFLACKKSGVLTYDYDVIINKIRQKGLKLTYVNEAYLKDMFFSLNIDYLENIFKESTKRQINTDIRPVSYYFNTLFFSSLFYSKNFIFKGLVKKLTNLEFTRKVIFIAVFLILVLLMLFFQLKPMHTKYVLPVVIATTGFCEMCIQITTLLAFQSLYGYMFYKISIIFSAFMIGLPIGTLYIDKKIKASDKINLSYLMNIQLYLILYPIIIAGLFWLCFKEIDIFLKGVGENIVFFIIPLISGFLGGMQFPIASKIYFRHNTRIGSATGVLYGMDLFGASLGAILTGIFLIPALGIFLTILLLFCINFMGLVFLFQYNKSFLPYNY